MFVCLFVAFFRLYFCYHSGDVVDEHIPALLLMYRVFHFYIFGQNHRTRRPQWLKFDLTFGCFCLEATFTYVLKLANFKAMAANEAPCLSVLVHFLCTFQGFFDTLIRSICLRFCDLLPRPTNKNNNNFRDTSVARLKANINTIYVNKFIKKTRKYLYWIVQVFFFSYFFIIRCDFSVFSTFNQNEKTEICFLFQFDGKSDFAFQCSPIVP